MSNLRCPDCNHTNHITRQTCIYLRLIRAHREIIQLEKRGADTGQLRAALKSTLDTYHREKK